MNRAFDEAFDEYSVRGLRYAMSLLRSSADAEEVVQEAFCRLLLSRHHVEVSEGFGAVFFTTVRNLCVDTLRRRQRRPTMSIAEVSVEPVLPETSDDSAALRHAVQEAVDELPDNWAGALKLRVEASLTYEEISTVLKCTKAQVRTWIYRARRQLEQTLVAQGLLNPQQTSARSN